MEFICRFHDGEALSEARERLRKKGIPSFAPEVEPRKMGSQWALFVYLPEQADDARRLLRDPDHEPAVRVDATAFETAIEQAKAAPFDASFVRRISIVGAVVVAGFLALMYLRSLWT